MDMRESDTEFRGGGGAVGSARGRGGELRADGYI